MKTKIIPLTVIILLSACAGGHLENPKVTTQAQLDADTHACQYAVDMAGASAGTDDPIGNGLRQGNLYNECMYQKGYRMVK